MTRPGTALSRTVDLLQAADLYARDWLEDGSSHLDLSGGELEALRHLLECLTRIVQTHPTVAEFAETYAARAAEALDIIERES